ncbi:DgyrCDS1193 [Dimorphilus gyrociliatus]|uniref:DgyrCDS1193 n=1 Tax=Dimorphilus gyrociliatus TaxID=2664684 RepID=A0A7I8V9F2_9ANNE|nr:DgyrCDS1193 [Dimorphilus gyrociliatus]
MNKISVRLADSTSRTENQISRKRSTMNEDDRKRDSRKRKRSYSVESSSDNGSDLDLNKDLKPIEEYVKDRQVMIKEMFASVSRDKLRAMLPEILKPIPMNDLQKFCCEELEVMSRKRIIRILQGKSKFCIVTCFIIANESSFEIIWLEIAV